MHTSGFDLDLKDNFIAYLLKLSCNFCLLYHVCTTEPACKRNIYAIKEGLTAIEH